jgi:hypothetical protein
MKPLVTILSIVAVLIAAGAADARGRDDCNVPMADWQPREKVAAVVAEIGWIVRRIKIDDGCYEVIGTDQGGRRVEAHVHPASLKVMRIEYEDDEHESDEAGEDGPDHSPHPAHSD